MQIAARGGKRSCRAGVSLCRSQIANADCSMRGRGELQVAGDRVCRSQIANADCSTRRRGKLQGWGQSADLRLQMQIAARGGNAGERGAAGPQAPLSPQRRAKEGSLQIPDCKCRLQHAGERGAAGLGTGSADSRLQIQIAARDREGRCRGTGPVCRSQIANTDCSTQPRGGLQRQG